MFDFDWTEIALIGVVALIAIGPKDLPVAIKTIAGFVKKARKMAGEFQGHVDEMVREANLHEVRDQIAQLKGFDIKGEIAKAVDADGSIRATMNENPLAPTTQVVPPLTEMVVETLPEHSIAEPPAPPSFIPPTADITPPRAPIRAEPAPVAPPSFVPPGTTQAEPTQVPPQAV